MYCFRKRFWHEPLSARRDGGFWRSLCGKDAVLFAKGWAFRFAVDNGFLDFQVAGADVVPHEAVQEPGEFGEVVFFEHAGGVLDGRLQAAKNPLVFEREQALVHREFGSKRTGLFELRVKETAGVPQLVAEVTADFELLHFVPNAGLGHAQASLGATLNLCICRWC